MLDLKLRFIWLKCEKRRQIYHYQQVILYTMEAPPLWTLSHVCFPIPDQQTAFFFSRVVSGLSALPCSLHRRWHIVQRRSKDPESVVCPVGGREQEVGGLSPLSPDTLTHTHTCLMPFALNWGKFQTNLLRLSHPVLLQFTPGVSELASERGGGRRRRRRRLGGGGGGGRREQRSWSWPKNNSLWTFSMSQRHKAAPSNIYQKAVPDHCAGRGAFGKERSLKMIQKHLCSSALEPAPSLFLSGVWMVMWKERKTLPFFPTCPQFIWVIIWASIESFSVTDAGCNSFNALGSWERICICMIGLHNK